MCQSLGETLTIVFRSFPNFTAIGQSQVVTPPKLGLTSISGRCPQLGAMAVPRQFARVYNE